VAAADTRGGPRASHDVSATAPGHGAGARRAGARRRRGSAVVEGEAGRDAPGD
jgi:hypothetical protein